LGVAFDEQMFTWNNIETPDFASTCWCRPKSYQLSGLNDAWSPQKRLVSPLRDFLRSSPIRQQETNNRAETRMSHFFQNSDVRLFRFALILASILVAMHFQSQTAKSQQFSQAAVWSTSYTEAADEAYNRDLPILLFFTGSDWCPWSRKLTTEVFETDDFAAWSTDRMILVRVEFPKHKTLPAHLATQNNSLLERYRAHVGGLPTVLFLTPNGTVVGKLGYQKGGAIAWTHSAQKFVGKQDKVASRLHGQPSPDDATRRATFQIATR